MSMVRYDYMGEQWRTTIAGRRWYTVRDESDGFGERVVCSTFDYDMAADLAEFEQARYEREGGA